MAQVNQVWYQMSDFIANGRHHPITFSNDNYGFVISGNYLDDVYRYDKLSDTWLQLQNIPFSGRGYAYGVSSGNKAYMGFGSTSSNSYPTDWWEYDMDNDIWNQKASFPGSGRKHPAMVVVNNKIYMGCGNNNNGNLGDWWEYDISNDLWTQKTDFPAIERHHPYYFNINNLAYVGFGHSNTGILKDFYQYDPSNDTWTQLNDFPGEGRVAGTQFSYNGKGYILSGDGDDHGPLDSGEFWEYETLDDSWTQLTSHPEGARWAPGSFVIDCDVYFLLGYNHATNSFPLTIYKYKLSEDCGCTDPSATNYDVLANTDDGSCIYQMTYVPDDNFEQALIDLGFDDLLDDSVLTANISTITTLYLSNKNISDLTGIEDFIALDELRCPQNQLTSLDVSSNRFLTLLRCQNNQLTNLDVSNNPALTDLICHNNQLTSLDVSSNNVLSMLWCSSNQLISLDLRNKNNLGILWCQNNQLKSLDLRNGNNTSIYSFDATSNPNLLCISVNDPVWSTTNWANIDAHTSFSSNCPIICVGDAITGLSVSNIIDDRAVLNFDNMNTYDASGNQICRVDQIRIKYRPVGTSAWNQKNLGSPTGYNNGVCNSTQKTEKNLYGLTLDTEYEWQVKLWYCSGEVTGWEQGPNFTTAPECPNVGNFTAYGANPTKATFNWDDSNGAYEFVRIKIRLNSISNPTVSDFIQVGGAGISYGTFTKDKNGLTPGETYRGQARTWCDPNGGAFNALSWTAPPIIWTQPTNRIEGGESIKHLDIYPNPSKDVFNISFTSEFVQDLRVVVRNVIGEELIVEDLQQFIGEYTKQINLKDNAKGIYLLEIETNEGIIDKKLMLQ